MYFLFYRIFLGVASLEKNIQNEDYLREIFRNITNEEADHWNPMSDNPIIPNTQEKPIDVDSEHGAAEDNAQGDPLDAYNDGDEDVHVVTPSANQNKKPRVAAVDRKKANSSTAFLIHEAIWKISDCSSSFTEKKQAEVTIKEVMDHVLDCAADYGSDEDDIATQLFVKKDYREMFMTLPTREIRL
jgi:hypothetical protein